MELRPPKLIKIDSWVKCRDTTMSKAIEREIFCRPLRIGYSNTR